MAPRKTPSRRSGSRQSSGKKPPSNRAPEKARRGGKKGNPLDQGLQALERLQAGDTKAALTAAQKMRAAVASLNRPDIVALAELLVGRIHAQAGRRALAERYYRKALELHPTAIGHIFLGHLLWQMDRSTEAKMHFRQALKLEPENPEAHFNLAMWYKSHRDYARTVIHLRRAIEARPDYPDAVVQLAIALWEFGRRGLNQARELMKRAVQLHPEHIEAHIVLALTLVLLKKYREAEGHLRHTLQDHPDDQRLHLCLGVILSRYRNNPAEAGEHFRRAVELEPGKGMAYRYSRQFLSEHQRSIESEIPGYRS